MSLVRRGVVDPVRGFIRAVKPPMQKRYARLRRRTLSRIHFIGITGSSGKTTTTLLIGAILSSAGRCHVTVNANTLNVVFRTCRKVPRRARYCVQEIGASVPGSVAEMAALLRPTLAVVTTIGREHYTDFRTIEDMAREKAALVQALPDNGVAILNADDPHVSSMSALTSARVVTYGASQGADVRMSDVSAVWPERLSLTVHWRDRSARVQTRLVGAHWAPSASAAVACGLSLGVELEDCARVIETVEPALTRFSVHPYSTGTFILDSQKAPAWSLHTCMDAIAAARARHKTIVIGTISDTPGTTSSKYRKAAEQALEIADRILFVGPQSHRVRGLLNDATSKRLLLFSSAYEAHEFLSANVVQDDLIYVKGSISDHLERLAYAQTEKVVCWKARCGERKTCDSCKHYRTPSPPPAPVDMYAKRPKPPA